MKNIATNFLIFTFLICFDILGQSTTYKFNTGLNLSNFKYTINDNGNTFSYYNGDRIALFFGLGIENSVQIINNYNILINAELQYSQQGNSFNDEFIGFQNNFNDQINLLLTLKNELIRNIYFGGGFYTGYIIYVDEYFREDEETHKKFDFGLIGSLEYRILKKISIEIRYLHGLSDILNREFSSGSITHDKYNKVFQIGLNYRF